jgi:tetratricopeptide (TPR) repeat protein
MSITPASDRPQRPSRLDGFTDREDLIAAFELNLERKKPKEYRVMVFYGSGGIGKSTLLQKLAQLHRDQFPMALMGGLDLNGADTTPPDLLLYRLSRRFPTIPFPSFSLALAIYGRRFHPEQVYGNDRQELLQGAGPFADVLDVGLQALEVMSGLATVLKVMKSAAAANKYLMDWVTGRAEPWLQDSQSMSEDEFLAQLPLQWAKDFRQEIYRHFDQEWDDSIIYNGAMPLITLDTYEILWHPGMAKIGRRREMRERWLVDLVSELPEVLWVIGGRDRLSWDVYNKEWDKVCDQYRVNQLSLDDSRKFLVKRDIVDPLIVEKILRHSAGMPFYLELQAQLYDNTPPELRTPDVFGGTHKQLIERLLTHLDPSEQTTLRLLSAFGIWDQDLFRQAVSNFGTGYPATGAADFGRFWSIEPIGQGRWQLHNEMVHHLQADQEQRDPTTFKEVHQWGFAYFDNPLVGLQAKTIQAEDAERLQRALTHALHIQPATVWAAWLINRLVQLEKGTIWQPLLAVAEIGVQQAEHELGRNHPVLAGLLHRQAILLQQIALYKEAEPLFRRALAILEANFGLDHPEVAVLLSDLSTLLQAINRLPEAVPLMRRALEIAEVSYGPGHPEVGNYLSNLAMLLQTNNRLVDAEPLMRRALAIAEASYGPDNAQLANFLSNLAQLLQATNRLADAEPLMRRALAIDQASCVDHPDVARGLNNLATLLQETNRLPEAETLMRRALQIEEASYGPDHPNVARALSSLAMVLLDTNSVAEAEKLMVRALAIEEAKSGPDHPNVAIRLSQRARILLDTNRPSEAEQLIRRALQIDIVSFGSEHPNVAIRLEILGRSMNAIGDHQEAEKHARDALAIDEEKFGPDHPNVAFDLHSLAHILKSTHRLDQANALMRRSLDILHKSNIQNGHKHKKWQRYLDDYRGILEAQGFTATEVEGILCVRYQCCEG